MLTIIVASCSGVWHEFCDGNLIIEMHCASDSQCVTETVRMARTNGREQQDEEDAMRTGRLWMVGLLMLLTAAFALPGGVETAPLREGI